MKRIRINVTAKDIKEGVRRSSKCCPVARATLRCFSEVRLDINVYCGKIEIARDNYISLTKKGFNIIPKIEKFVDDFDEGRPVKPFRLYLDVPDELEQYL